ncbi:hypothetical protein D9M70_581330 [compost metagenome]
MSRTIRILGLSLSPRGFYVVAASSFVFALTAGGAWFPMANACSTLLDILLSAQVVSFGLLIGAALFLYAGVLNWRPVWTRVVVFFNAAVLGIYLGNQVLPLLLGGL